jgi:hypothetical protein
MFSKKEKRKKRKKKGPHRFTMTLKNRNKHKMMKEQVGDYSQFLKMRETQKVGRNCPGKIVVG